MDGGKVPPLLHIIESIAHHETVGDIEGHVFRPTSHQIGLPLVQEGRYLDRRGPALQHMPAEPIGGTPRIDYILDHYDVPSGYLSAQICCKNYRARG